MIRAICGKNLAFLPQMNYRFIYAIRQKSA
jgi:hypothetical protein